MSSDEPRILIVDDEPKIRELYAEFIADMGVIDAASDADEAVAKLDDAPDVVLLDRRLPGPSGDTVLEEIRRRGLDCGVIMVSAVEPTEHVIDLPFNDYVTKPVTATQLRERIERVLALSRRDLQLQRYISLLARRRALEESPGTTAAERDRALADLDRQIDTLEARIEPSLDDLDRELVSRLATGPIADEEERLEQHAQLESLFG